MTIDGYAAKAEAAVERRPAGSQWPGQEAGGPFRAAAGHRPRHPASVEILRFLVDDERSRAE